MKNRTHQVPPEIDFIAEPRGIAYSRLIDFAQRQCAKFSVVWREDLGNKRKENELARKLEPFIVADTMTSAWPGTEIIGATANVCFYKLNSETANILKKAERLYQWEAPNFPEDLAFYVKNSNIWLATVAHEHMGWLHSASVPESEQAAVLSFLFENGIINKKYA
jgi:hypothetical protein